MTNQNSEQLKSQEKNSTTHRISQYNITKPINNKKKKYKSNN